MTFGPEFTTRGAVEADAGRVIELIHEAEAVDLGETLLELVDLEADWAMPRIDIADDVILVQSGDDLIAWAQVSGERADADVHPVARGRGIGTALVQWTEERALARAADATAVRLGQTLPEGLDGTAALFSARGYERLWESWVLHLPADVGLAERPRPHGVSIRPFRSAEEHAVYTVVDDAFSEWDGRDSEPFEAWQSGTTKRPDFDPERLLVAVIDDVIVGAIVAVDYPADSWVDQIAVRPENRNQGIASALLATVFADFRGRGRNLIRLNTDSRTGALGLYLGLGMELEHTFVRWSRLLRPETTG